MTPIRGLCAGALAAALLACAGGAAAQAPADARPRYAHCNVALPGACFGIARGDVLTLKVGTDHLLYEVSFATGRKARVYAGPRPPVGPDDLGTFEDCARPNGFGECRLRRFANGAVEMLARRDAKGDHIHVVVARGLGGEREMHAFLENFRACRADAACASVR